MEFIAHRINTIKELKNVSAEYGVELDIRDNGDKLILHHDPFTTGEDFEEYLKHYKHGTMILNIKSERIEYKVLELINKYNIKKYFFLDSSFPMIYKLTSNGEKNIALRFSEFEGLGTVLKMKGKADWVWIDCFTNLPVNKENYEVLKNAGFKLCLVSPCLVNREHDIQEYRSYLSSNNIKIDAVCARIHNIKQWEYKYKYSRAELYNKDNKKVE
ncbi:hypothetical protein ACFL4O_00985 [bacterium]